MTIDESKSTSHFSQLQTFKTNYHAVKVANTKNRSIQFNDQ